MIRSVVNSDDILEAGGVTTLLSAVAFNIWDMISNFPINGIFVALTSIGGLIYLYWKIKTQKRSANLKKLEMEKERLEIEKERLELDKLKGNDSQ